MEEKVFSTERGDIHYYVSIKDPELKTLLLLPGLSADHRLFDKQVEYFESKYNLFCWDAPGHAASRPFKLDFKLDDKAKWLHDILEKEGINKPVFIGQSMGGYVSQAFAELYPDEMGGFISIDSAPLKKEYSDALSLLFMDNAKLMYRMYPWDTLCKSASEGVSCTKHGRENMLHMMMVYNDYPKYYSSLVGHGYKMLAKAIRADLEYEIKCPALLICGERDRAGFTRKYNKRWAEKSGIPIRWIKGAGHNSNVDKPDEINSVIEEFLNRL